MNTNRRFSSVVSDDTPTQKQSSAIEDAVKEYYETIFEEGDPSDIHHCDHTSQIEETCLNCGEELAKRNLHHREWSDPNKTRIQRRKALESSIKKDLEPLDLSKIIAEKASSLYSEVTRNKILRGNHRRSVVCACIFYAYKLTGNSQTYNDIIELMNITKTDGVKGIKFFRMNSSHLPEATNSPEVLIKSLMEKICVETKDNVVEEITHLYHKIYNRSSLINKSRTHSVISGLIFFWICLRKIDLKVAKFASMVELSPLTIIKIAEEISEILKTEIVIK